MRFPKRTNGSTYAAGASGDLPRLTAFSSAGNVLQFRYEPFVSPQPVLLRINNAGDWAGRAQVGGAPPTISVQSETFLNATQGLANPVNVNLGQVHPLAVYGLANQYTNQISLFSFQPAAGDKITEVSISPVPGAYHAAINVGFTTAPPGHLVYFRVGVTAPWQLYRNQPVRLFTNATVQYYGQPAAGAVKSALQSAAYTFTVSPGALDSNQDGVPDFVAIAKGLDPNGPRDSDHDGFSDLEELLHNTDPLVATNYPTTNQWASDRLHINDQATFDLWARSLPWDGYSNTTTLVAANTATYAYDLNGGFLGMATADTNSWSRARLSNVVANPDQRLLLMATDPHFRILTTNADTAIGREMIGLLTAPALHPLSVTNSYAAGDLTTAARSWILAASNAWWGMSRTVLSDDLTIYDTLTALLLERKMAQILGARGTNWWTNLTLFPHRVPDLGRINPDQPSLLSLEKEMSPTLPGYKLQTMYQTINNLAQNSGATTITNLRKVVRDLYGISSRLHNDHPTQFVSPVDEIRTFLWSGTLDSNYLHAATTTTSTLASASNGVNTILNSVVKRPTTNTLLVVRSDTFSGACRILAQFGTGTNYSLFNDSGLPYSLPGSFDLAPGATMLVAGYTDVTNTSCASRNLEVTNVMLISVPVPSDGDLDGNLLIDSWEKQFFGAAGQDPFGDADGDGYKNLQEMLEGSDPRDATNLPNCPTNSFASPQLYITSAGTNVNLFFTWPAAYQGSMTFGVRSTAALGNAPFVNLAGATALWAGGDWMYFSLPAVPDPSRFYHLWISLGPARP